MLNRKIIFGIAAALAITTSMAFAGTSPSSPPSSHTSSPPSRSYSAPSAPSAPRTYSAPPPSGNSGYNRPTPSTPPPAAIQTQPHPPPPPPSSNGYSRPPTTSTPPVTTSSPNATQVTPPRPQPTGALSTASRQQVSNDSLRAYQTERNSYRQPPSPVSQTQVRSDPVYTSARSSFGGNPNTYYERRTVVYNNYRSNHPDVFIINNNLRPNYGIFDSGFLTGMVMGYVGASMVSNATWMLAHQHQPWYNGYYGDLQRQAQTNAELRARLATLEAEMAAQRARGVTVSPTTMALPDGVDPAMAIAPEAVNADADATPIASSHENNGVGWGSILLMLLGGVILFVIIIKLIRQ